MLLKPLWFHQAPPGVQLLAVMAMLTIGVGARCGGSGIQGVALESGSLFDDPVIHLGAQLSARLDPGSVEVEIDGTDLIEAMGLMVPFTDASGLVPIGGDPVTVSGFSVEAFPEIRVDLDLSGLPTGDHEFRVRALTASGGSGSQAIRTFVVVDPLTLELDALVASARPEPETASPTLTLFGATLGHPLAASPVGLADGGELRQGFVEAAEARIYGGTP